SFDEADNKQPDYEAYERGNPKAKMPAGKEKRSRATKQDQPDCKRDPPLPGTRRSPPPAILLCREPNSFFAGLHIQSPVVERPGSPTRRQWRPTWNRGTLAGFGASAGSTPGLGMWLR